MIIKDAQLLIHSNNNDGSVIFTDSSPSGHNITIQGDVHHETDEYKFQGSSIKFDGSYDYLYVTDSDEFDSDGGDFTIEFWMYPLSVTNTQVLCGQSNYAGSSFANSFELMSSSTLRFWQTISNTIVSTSTLVVNTWAHIAVTYLSGTITLYINGVSEGSITQAADTVQTSGYAIGRNGDYDDLYYNGYIDEFLIIKGKGLRNGSFTPPDAPYKIASYSVSGYVKDGNTPISRRVYAYLRSSGELIGETTSASGTGYYSIEVSVDDNVNLMCIDDDDGIEYNDLLISRVTPDEL